MKFIDYIYSKKIEKKHTVHRILGVKFKIRNGRLETSLKRKEKKYDVGILSFNINTDVCNYGAALHSFAFQKYLDNLGVNNVIVNYYPEIVKLTPRYVQILENFKNKQFIEMFYNLRNLFYLIIKKVKFYSFFKKHCRITKHRYEVDTLYQLKTIKQFVCETDVTWHKFSTGYDRGFLCDLKNMRNKPNVAYSIDFGSKGISEKAKSKLKKFANNFKYISIRNIFRLDEMKEILNREDVVITIDPTLLLCENDYLNIIKEPEDSDFVFVYNCKENNEEMVKSASEFANKHNLKLKILNCYDKNITDIKNSYPNPYSIEEFLGHIKYCKYFFTNSYHGICFAILFKKEFCCFARKANNDKILTLLEIFGLQNRFYENENIFDLEIDYTNVEKLLNKWRESSEKFVYQSIINELQTEKENIQ